MENEIDIYAVNIANKLDAELYKKLLSYVDEDKRKKINKFQHNADKVRALIGDVLIRSIISSKMKRPNEEIEYEYNNYGKPALKNNQGFQFNVSHSGDWVVSIVSYHDAVRIKSILKKASEDGVNASSSILTPANAVERDLMLKLTRFGEAIENSYEDKAPNKICEYLYDLSNLFNRFYHENKILSEEDLNKKASWISLLKLTLGILDSGLNLLGIESPERM